MCSWPTGRGLVAQVKERTPDKGLACRRVPALEGDGRARFVS